MKQSKIKPMLTRAKTFYFVLIMVLLNQGCINIPTVAERLEQADQLTLEKNWRRAVFKGETFDLVSYSAVPTKTRVLTVYIEGDGFAWLTSSKPSLNPTPLHPVGLKLAISQQTGEAAYLARPCQFTKTISWRGCQTAFWTNKRFSEEVIADTNTALSSLKLAFAASELRLVGYSGGAAVALLLAARRDDVKTVITVAGNLNHQAWTSLKKLAPLDGSLNPIDYLNKLHLIKQIHFVGENDTIIPKVLAADFSQLFSDDVDIKVIVVPNLDHSCCWHTEWPQLLERIE